MILAFSYIRFSSEGQKYGSSVERQLDAAQHYAKQHGLKLNASTYRDLGVSAFKSKNRLEGALGAFIEAVQRKKIPADSYLLIESFDRLSRDSVDRALALFLELVNAGITIVTLMDGQVYSQRTMRTNWTQLIIALACMARAHEESATKSRRIREAFARRVERGELPVCKPPSWLRIVDKKSFVVIPAKAKVVNRIFDLAAKGLGGRLIAQQLNEGGISTFQSAKEWTQGVVNGIVRSPSVHGARGDDEHFYPPIMSKEKYQAALAAMRGRQWKGGRGKEGASNLFAGVAFCECCGGRMRYNSVVSDKPYVKPSIRCRRANDHLGCLAKTFPYEPCERAFLHALANAESLAGFGDLAAKSRAEEAALRAEIETLKQAQRRLITLAKLTEGMEEVAAELQATQQRLEAVNCKLRDGTVIPLTVRELGEHRDTLVEFLALIELPPQPRSLTRARALRAEVLNKRRAMRAVLSRLVKRVAFGFGSQGWEPVLFVTLQDGSQMSIDVTKYLSRRGLLKHQKLIVKPSDAMPARRTA